MTIHKILNAWSLIILFIIVACSNNSNKKSDFSSESLDNLIDEYFGLKYRYLASPLGITSSRDQATRYFSEEKTGNEAMVQFDTLKNIISRGSLLYLNSKTTVRIIDSTMQRNGETAVFVVKVESVFETNVKSEATGEAITVEGIEYYKMTVKSLNEGLKIVSEEPLDKTFSSSLEQSKPPQTFTPQVEFLPPYKYSPTAAVKWAIDHWNKPPTSGYYDYTKLGGDCTNFISHSLRAGGWIQNNDWFWKSNGASGNDMSRFERSPSWTGANSFFVYANSTNGKKRLSATFQKVLIPATWTEVEFAKIKTVIVGDIIQIASKDATPVAVHTMIVTEKLSKAPYVLLTFRNSDCDDCIAFRNKPIDQISPDLYLYGFGVKENGN